MLVCKKNVPDHTNSSNSKIMESKSVKQLNSSRRLILVLLGVIVGSLILNQGHAQGKNDNSLLWEVSGKGIKTSYVYGTFHLMPQSDFDLKERVTKAFDASEQIVMELDMDNPNMQMELMQNASMKNGVTIDQLMTEEEYSKLDAFIKQSLGIGLDQLKTLKPFFVASMLLPTMIEGTPASYEMTFLQRAIDGEKEILGLETPTFQAQVFDNIPYEDQINDLMDVVNEQDEMEKLFRRMIDYYKAENISEMYDLMVEYMDSEDEEKYLLSDRNANWIPKIGELSKEKTTFYAVGAGHLGGENGVIKLLKEAGYKVKPVKK